MVTDPRDPDDEQRLLRRRRVLGAAGVSLAALAGCAADDEGDPGGDDSTQEPPDDQADTESDDDADEEEEEDSDPLEDINISIDAPNVGDAGVRITYDFVVENNSENSLTTDIDVSARWPDGTEELLWDARNEHIALDGDWQSDQSWVFTSDTGTMELRVDVAPADLDGVVSETQSIDIGAVELDWGESIHLASDQVITFGEPELADEYEYETFSGETETNTAPAGEQFVFIDVEVANESDSQRTTPNRLSFELATADMQTAPIRLTNYDRDDAYQGLNELLDGVVEAGVLPYQIPSDADRDDLRLIHEWSEPESAVGWQILVGDD